MTAQEIARAYAERLESRDWNAFRDLLHPNLVYEIPQTRERIRGRERYVTFNAEYPGAWHIAPQLILGDERNACVLFRWTLEGATSQAIVFLEVEGGRITRITDFWPESYDPPSGREHLVERF